MNLALLVALSGTILLGFRLTPRSLGRARPVLTSHNAVLFLFGFYVLLPGVLISTAGGQYTWAPGYSDELTSTLLLATLAGLSFVGAGAVATARRSSGHLNRHAKDERLAPSQRRADRPIYPALPWVLLLLGLSLKLAFLQSTGGLNTALLRLSGGTQEATGTAELAAAAIGLRTLSGIADGAATWILVEAMKSRRNWLLPALVFTATIALSFAMGGKRLLIVLPLCAAGLAFHRFVRPLTVGFAPILAIIVGALAMATLLFRILVPASVADVRINLDSVPWAQGSLIRFYFYSLEFSTVEMISVAVAARDAIVQELGGTFSAFFTTNLEPLAYVVPRALWPGKPTEFIDLSYSISGAINNYSVYDAKVGYASTLIGTSFIYGGAIGVAVTFAVFGYATRVVDQTRIASDRSAQSVFTFALVVIFAFHFFRQGTIGWAFIVTVVQQFGFIIAIATIVALRPKKNWAGSPHRFAEDRYT